MSEPDVMQWVSAEWESRELLALCLKHVPGLGKMHIVDAAFVWTEPHSKRIKVSIHARYQVTESMGADRLEALPVSNVRGRCGSRCKRRYWVEWKSSSGWRQSLSFGTSSVTTAIARSPSTHGRPRSRLVLVLVGRIRRATQCQKTGMPNAWADPAAG
jgi:hypothetical protein